MTTIRFADYHRPNLPAGKYRLSAKVTVPGVGAPYASSLRFQVGGPVQPLQPDDVAAVFPPEGSFGDHSTALPHVLLTDPALPWTRLGDGADAPWLALLTLRATDPVQPIYGMSKVDPDGPMVETVTLPSAFLASIAPRRGDLALLCHVRETAETGRGWAMSAAAHRGDTVPDPEADGPVQAKAAVIGNRLPGAGMASTCLLVAVEGLYDQASNDIVTQTATQLIVLKRWAFSCDTGGHSFLGQMARIKANAGLLCLPAPADAVLADGTVALPMIFREGSRSAALYRGPLIAVRPAAGPVQPPHEVQTADALLRFDPDTGLFDTSYAAAWQIGRLIGLATKSFARALSVARRQQARQDLTQAREADLAHLALLRAGNRAAPAPVAPDFAAMALRLARLEGVPFAYLVPDEAALPPESFRFFCVDPDWIGALVAGAFGIGRTHPADRDREAGLRPEDLPVARCGFLLRSDVVSHWPGLMVEGVPLDGSPSIAPLRLQVLSPTLMLALFDRDLRRVDMHLHPESLHHGFDGAEGASLTRVLRDPSGDLVAGHKVTLDAASPLWRDQGLGVLDPAALALAMAGQMPGWDMALAPKTGAGFFGFQMMQGIGRASFDIDLS